MRIAIDTWAFVEQAVDGPRRQELASVLKSADGFITSREIVAETFNFIVVRTRRTRDALEWLADLRASRTQVVETPMATIEGFLRSLSGSATLSYADASLVLAARESGIAHVATEDSGFLQAKLVPLFSKRR